MARIGGFTGIVFLLLACSPGVTHAATDPQAVRADDAGTLAGIVRTLDWGREGPYTFRSVNVSGDIQTARKITFKAKDVAPPAACLKRDDCRKAVTMVIPGDVACVKCVETVDVMGTAHCSQAVLSQNCGFRLRVKLVDTHPWKYNFIPVIEFLQPSSAGCRPSEIECVKDKTCWKNFNSYCRQCLGHPVEKCVCRNERGPLPDRTACTFMISGDMICVGDCRDGQCEPTDERCR